MAIIAIIPAVNVVDKVFSPNEAPTVLELISVNLLGRDPLLIKSTKLLTSSCVKLPCRERKYLYF